MDTPTYNANDHEVYKPQPGQFFPGGLNYAQSYGGIVSALQDIQVAAGGDTKSYPNNFAGIIAAIEDLKEYLVTGEKPDVGAPPPGWEIIIDLDGNVIGGDFPPGKEPVDGTLWFDTRQGRLFIAIDGEFYQTNGADGISHVGPNPPVNPPVIGQHWLDTDTGLFYVYVGEGLWQAVVSDGDITITTATLPLALARTTADPLYQPSILPDIPGIDQMQVQKDYNTWLLEALVSLDQAITEGSVSISETPPTDNVVPGTLWYDSTTLELSIYYEDDTSSQWVPVSTGYAIEDAVAPIKESLEAEIRARANAVENIYSMISEMDNIDDARVDALEQSLTALTTQVNAISIPDITPLAEKSELTPIVERINVLESEEVDLSAYATTQMVATTKQSLLDTINSKTYLELSDITPLIPDVSAKVEQSDINESIANITVQYLPRTGGTLTGSFVVEKEDYSAPGFDFSTAYWHSKDAFKFATYNPSGASNAVFGTTDKAWEYAWQFSDHEDFCWIYNDSNKVFSITKDGPACSTLYLGDIAPNNTNGRIIHNKIDLKERLHTYQNAFEQIRQGVSSSTDYDSLKANLLSALANV